MIKNKFITRANNVIDIQYGFVQKTGVDSEKLLNEFKWLEAMNKNIYIPAVSQIQHGYEIRLINGSNLGETFWSLTYSEQKNIVNIYLDFIFTNLESNKNTKYSFSNLLLRKNELRYTQMLKEGFAENTKMDELKKLHELYMSTMIKQIDFISKNSFGIMHGDLFFGNTIFDGTKIYFIDPKGFDDEFGIYGSVYYDIIKLSHSLHGKYDGIIFNYNVFNNNEKILTYFFNKVNEIFGFSKDIILLGEMGLFLSMLPLHNDSQERQNRLLDKAIIIAKEIEWKNL